MNFSSRNPDYRGNLCFQILFFWLDKIIFKGSRSTLTPSDFHPCPREQGSQKLYKKFEPFWKMELKKHSGPNIKIALAKTLKGTFLIVVFILFIEAMFIILQMILVNQFSATCTEGSVNQTITEIGSSLAYTVAISLIALIIPITHVIGYYLIHCVGMQMRTICTTAIFKKIINVQHSILHQVSTGHILNLVSNDVYKFDIGTRYLGFFFISPVVAILSTILTSVYIGPVGLMGLAYIILHTPLQSGLAFLFGYFRHHESTTADDRVRLMDQIIRGMQVIKFYVWEIPFIKYVSKIRRKEILYASLAGVTQSSTYSFFASSLFVALFLMYFVSIVLNQPLNSSQLALAFLVFNTVRLYFVALLGNAIFTSRECVIALKRIQRILELPESATNNLNHTINSTTNNQIKLIDFSASWKGTSEVHKNDVVLKSVNLNLGGPQLVAIAGSIGSGKSSLLLSLINELPGLSGQLCIKGVTSYCSQVPWIFSGSIRDNILFGNELDPDHYWQVINVCSLEEDFDSLESGDMTIVGERGVTLSGGQKARVSLARSVYHRADIYLLDDPLSAVDSKVGREIFDNCIRGFLREKIVVLVTHQIHFVRNADLILTMSQGTIACSGTYQDVIVKDDFSSKFFKGLEKKEDEKEHSILARKISANIEITPEILNSSSNPKVSTKPLSSSLTDENFKSQSFGLYTYLRYFWAGGFIATISLIILSALSIGSLLLGYWWMQSMATCSELIVQNQTNATTISTCPWYFDYRHSGSLNLLALMVFTGTVLTFLRGFNFYYVVLQASRRLHNSMLRSVVHLPMRFFDTNPSGRIVNRFSKDIGFLDEQLPMVFYDFWQHSTYTLAIAIAICIIQYFMIIPFVLLTISTLFLRYYYLRASTQIKRLESIARSPLYSHISLTLQGLSTIRALGIGERVSQDFHFFQDNHSRAWYYYIASEWWFGVRVDFLAALTIILGMFFAFFARCVFAREDLIEFSIPLLLSIAIIFQYMIRVSGQVDIFMVSVDRVLNYIGLTQEIINISPYVSKIPTHRLETSEIEYKNVNFRYSDELPYSLKNVSMAILPGEKIGIIGRTGAGKTSLFNSLLRITEISDGNITINGEDIQRMNLYEHRKRISVIPQDPFLFTGTLRFNLDPFEEFTTAEIWEVLEKSHLRNMVECLPGRLSADVKEDGLNFSTGERQLLCLTRAMLRKNKIILIDEATANVDLTTDQLIQQAIRAHFADCSVLTIAHRVETIIDSDRLAVLENGSIIELGTPSSMLQDEGSYLSKLLAHLDSNAQSILRNLAEKT